MEKSWIAESSDYGMNTVIWHKVYGKKAKKALEVSRKETARLEHLLSRYIPESDISKINASAGIKPVKISLEAYEVLSKAIDFAKISEGYFDITIGPLVDLWRNASHTSTPPNELSIQNIRPLINYRELVADPQKKTAFLKKEGQSIDLGGIGKGYAADKIIEIYKEYGISSAYTNFGGNVAVIGTKPDGTAWRVGIQNPRSAGELIGAVSVEDQSVVTSGDYQRYFTGNDGKRYHHLLNPATGYPSESGLISATVISSNSMTADAFSTMIFIAGLQKGNVILNCNPGIEAVLIDLNLQVYITRGLKDKFQTPEGVLVNVLNK